MRSASSLRLLALLLLLLPAAAGLPRPARADALDYAIPGGHFYRQANGQGGAGGSGYAITDEGGIPFWTAFQQLDGVQAVGYPASRRFTWDGFTVQVMQKVVFQWHPDSGQVMFVNVLDRLHDAGDDPWLQASRQTPPPSDTTPDRDLPWPQVAQRHWAMFDSNAAIKARYWADPDPLDHFGLPMSAADEGDSYVVRCQRAVFQYWKVAVPWAAAGQVTIANGGDLAKEVGMFPAAAITPTPGPAAGPAAPSHDWRSPGYVSDVGGVLYDPRGMPLRSAGSDVPNLAYGEDVGLNLDWLAAHHMRWVRVFATGHELGPDRAPGDAAQAIAALQAVLRQVDAFNARHDPAQSIYVLVSLTDYYPPGVPGDRFAYDHPTWAGSPVLPAPWYRAGVRSFNFDQEHNFGTVYNLPNYEVNYKPWVAQIVPALANDPGLLGWQLGDELKARGSPRNGISSDQAYGWYLDFTRDMVDTIRARDQHHLIVMGAQYIAELTDWPYRPNGPPDPTLVPHYRQLVRRMLDDCGQACWNVWGLTADNFNPYPIDDAMVFHQAGVAVVATEYGFWRSDAAAYGGDRAAAVRAGLAQPWQDIDGAWQPRRWGVVDLFAHTGLDGIAPWAAPAPSYTDGFDLDSDSGITGAPDQDALWSAWGDVAAALEAANWAGGAEPGRASAWPGRGPGIHGEVGREGRPGSPAVLRAQQLSRGRVVLHRPAELRREHVQVRDIEQIGAGRRHPPARPAAGRDGEAPALRGPACSAPVTEPPSPRIHRRRVPIATEGDFMGLIDRFVRWIACRQLLPARGSRRGPATLGGLTVGQQAGPGSRPFPAPTRRTSEWRDVRVPVVCVLAALGLVASAPAASADTPPGRITVTVHFSTGDPVPYPDFPYVNLSFISHHYGDARGRFTFIGQITDHQNCTYFGDFGPYTGEHGCLTPRTVAPGTTTSLDLVLAANPQNPLSPSLGPWRGLGTFRVAVRDTAGNPIPVTTLTVRRGALSSTTGVDVQGQATFQAPADVPFVLCAPIQRHQDVAVPDTCTGPLAVGAGETREVAIVGGDVSATAARGRIEGVVHLAGTSLPVLGATIELEGTPRIRSLAVDDHYEFLTISATFSVRLVPPTGDAVVGPDTRQVDVPANGRVEADFFVRPTNCRFVLGFAALHAAIPSVVGDCTDDEAHSPENGDGLQHTTNGLLVWRKADNLTAFTDGYRTWVNGPDGVQERLNTQRFPWEANPDRLPIAV